METFNILASMKPDNNTEIILTPLCDIYKKPNVSSRYHLWFNNPEVTKYNSHGLFPFRPDISINEILDDKSRIMWSIVCIKNPETMNIICMHIGNISLQRIDMINRSAEIACLIGEPLYWGKGIMTWALQQLIDHGFYKLGLNRIWSGTAATNKGMRKVFEKLGFKEEGVFVEGMYIDGSFVDVVAYGLLNHINNDIKAYSGINNIIELIPIENESNAHRILYKLLIERDEDKTINISHQKLPTIDMHCKFVTNHPYQDWCLIKANGKFVGSIYLTQSSIPSMAGNEIGIFIFKKYQGRGYGTTAIKLMMAKHKHDRYLANINPKNKKSINMFRKLGFKKCQHTYELNYKQ